MVDDCHDFARDRSVPIRIGEPNIGAVVSYQRPVGHATMEDIVMFARKVVFSSVGRACAVATVVAVALTAVEPSLAFAGAAPKDKGITTTTGTSRAADISARRRYHCGRGGAFAAAVFFRIGGSGLAIAA